MAEARCLGHFTVSSTRQTPGPRAQVEARGPATPRWTHRALAQPFRRSRPVVAIIGNNSGTELVDFVIPYGVLMASDAADVITVATQPGPITMRPALKLQPQTNDARLQRALSRRRRLRDRAGDGRPRRSAAARLDRRAKPPRRDHRQHLRRRPGRRQRRRCRTGHVATAHWATESMRAQHIPTPMGQERALRSRRPRRLQRRDQRRDADVAGAGRSDRRACARRRGRERAWRRRLGHAARQRRVPAALRRQPHRVRRDQLHQPLVPFGAAHRRAGGGGRRRDRAGGDRRRVLAHRSQPCVRARRVDDR